MKSKHRFYFDFDILLILLLGTICPLDIFAQDVEQVDELVNWSPDGMVVFVSDAALSEESPQSGRIEAIVSRRTGDESTFQQIARIQRPSSIEEIRQRAGDEFFTLLMEETNSSTEEELWEFIQQNPAIDDYGFLGFEPNLWRALGTAYFDTGSVEFTDGLTVEYQVEYVMEDGSISNAVMRGSDTVGRTPNILRPRNIDRIERDSLVGARWASPIEGSEDAFFARIYQQRNEEEDFVRVPDRLMARRNADSLIVYQWDQVAEPEQAYKVFIEPVDIVGNPGPRSDTLTVISVDFEKLPLLGEVSAKDTTTGIHLSWEQVPQKPYLTGIEISRSRDARRDFITLDTLSLAATEYLDTQLVPNRSYYYQFRIVTMRNRSEMPSAVASASFKNRSAPSPPAGLEAATEEEGIRLNWDSVEEPDLFAYYVYRGTSRYDSLAVVSPAIKDTTTFFDDAEELNGRTNYVYAVKAVNNSKLESELSNQVVIRPDRIERPPTPVGIEGYGEQQRVRLFWDDLTGRDDAVVGYHIYRSESPAEITPDSAAASVQAEQSGFERISEALVTTTSFDDINVESSKTYYYAVASVDMFDVESHLSTPVRFTSSRPALRPPSQVSARSVSNGVELRWNRTLQENATGYRIFRRTRSESEPIEIGLSDIGETQFLDQNVSGGELYWYSIAVIGEEGESQASREQSVRVD